ncbi:MAG: VOC family protein [Actinomycetota bacterium]|nr:VOC family protein [Actinomycetota bacterium]
MSDVLDHVAIRVSDLARSREFYEAALAALEFRVLYETGAERGRGVAFGRVGADDFAIHEPIAIPGRDTITRGAHLAFRADDARSVMAFHAAAVAHGGRSIGEPGPRPEYSEGYFGAFVLDPDGNNVEAVWHAPGPLEPDV